MTPAGERNRKVILQKPTSTTSASGATTQTFSDVKTVWAKREYKSASELYQSEQLVFQKLASFKILFRNDIDSTWRVKDGSEVYELLSVIEVGYREELMLEGRVRDNR